MPKTIILLADGTGNSSAKLFKTNVWRLYQALDLSEEPADGGLRQVAYYHDGVGTSAFKPLALLGGVFGVGLMRNVLDMYRFVCRNYAPGDRIFLFGFSRGAFTVRILASFLADQGVLRCATEQDLDRYAPDAYREYRRQFKLPIFGGKRQFQRANPDDPEPKRDRIVGLVDLLRLARDRGIGLWRKLSKQKQYAAAEAGMIEIPTLAFVGVWDTVAAYGMPLEELTRAVDDWLWPLSMPNYNLSEKVACARHALALDEERDSFQPLVWDEIWEAKLVALDRVRPGRLEQVWFAGVHSNVGGGYANDALSHVPLKWMMDEAEAAGLRFAPPAEWGWTLGPDPFGRRYDSRSGVAAYYRPQARRLIAKLDPPRPDTLVLQDPRYTPPGQLAEVTVHESVLRRIKHGTDRYAPIVLPPRFRVVDSGNPTQVEAPSAMQGVAEEWVYDDVWLRRIIYFVTVSVSLILLAMPVLHRLYPPGPCAGPQCLLVYPIGWAGQVLPAFLSRWVEAFQARPGVFALLAALIVVLRGLGMTRRIMIEDGMRELWAQSYGLPLGADRPATRAGQAAADGAAPSGWVYRLRTHPAYQRAVQTVKWRLLPGVIGAASLAALMAGVIWLVGYTVGIIR